jgi:hypothetical protein
MSDREFENYLTLLTGLLRLGGKQRDAIARELRSHLEDRLEELLAEGISREDAIKRALAEFGDAAGLAGQFVAISQHRKRRWLMRITTFSLAATLLIAAGLITFWPGRNAGPGRAAGIAQTPKVDPFAPAPRVDAPPQEPTLQEKLDKRISFDVVELPLRDVIAYLKQETGIQSVLQLKKLDEASISADTPITKSLENVRVSTLLDLLLMDLELTYVEKDGLLLITTPEDAESRLEIRVYDCRDLLAMPAPPGADKFIPRPRPGSSGGMFSVEDPVPTKSSRPAGGGGFGGPSDSAADDKNARPISEHDLRAERLMDIIVTNVDSQSWEEVGGPGSISEYNGLIVVTQTDEVHKKVEHVFDMLREAAGLDTPKGTRVVR